MNKDLQNTDQPQRCGIQCDFENQKRVYAIGQKDGRRATKSGPFRERL